MMFTVVTIIDSKVSSMLLPEKHQKFNISKHRILIQEKNLIKVVRSPSYNI